MNIKLYYINLLWSLLWFSVHANAQTQELEVVKAGIYINPPKVYIQNKKPAGIFVDILEKAANQNHFKIHYIQGEWVDLLIMLEKGEIEIMPDMAYSEQRDCLYTFNKISVLNSWVEVFASKQYAISGMHSLRNKRVGVFQGSVQETYIKDSVLNNSDFFMQIVSYMNYEQMSMALINKEIDALIAHRFFYFSEYFHPDFQPTGIILHPTNLYFAFKKNSNPELNNAIDRTLSLLKNEPNSLFYKSLDNLLTRKPDKWIPVYIFVILGLVFFGFMVAGIFVFLLRKIVNRKISELNQQKIELMHAKELAEEGEKRKNAFLQNISHEIRTPMNAIIGFTSFLNNPDLGEEKRATFIGYIQESSHQLLLVLENMITIASLTQKLETPELVPMVVSDELNLFYKEYFSLASQKGLNLLISIKNKNLERKVWADKQKIIQILRSLLNNSIKFTQTGQVSLGCCIIEPYKGVGISENYQLKFFVRDTGIGIKPENLKKVFESFYQADKNVQITYGGAGLGLSIAKEMVALLGGQIWLESQPMVGTTVYFTIPLRFYEDA